MVEEKQCCLPCSRGKGGRSKECVTLAARRVEWSGGGGGGGKRERKNLREGINVKGCLPFPLLLDFSLERHCGGGGGGVGGEVGVARLKSQTVRARLLNNAKEEEEEEEEEEEFLFD